MPRFADIGFYDLSNLFASYIAKHKRGLVESASPLHKGVRTLDLLNDREESPVLADWKPAQAFLQRVKARLSSLPKPADLLNAYVCAFDADGIEAWHREDVIDPDAFMRLHLLMHPAPALRLHCGPETMAPPPWHAVAVDHREMLSITNLSAPAVAHVLTLELALDVEG